MSLVAKGNFEDLIFVIFALIWGVSSLLTRLAKKRIEQTRAQGTATPGARPKPGRPPKPPGGDGGEQLRRFLEELTGVKIETHPTAQEKLQPPPTPRMTPETAVPTWSAEAAYAPHPVAASRREKKRKHAPATASAGAPSRPMPLPAEPCKTAQEPVGVAARPLRATSMRMPAMHFATMRIGSGGTMRAGGGGPQQNARHLALRKGQTLRDAIRYRILLGPPRALQPNGGTYPDQG